MRKSLTLKRIINNRPFVIDNVSYRWAAIHSRELKEEDRVTGKIFAEAIRRGWRKPPAEVEKIFESFSGKAPGILAVANYDYSPVNPDSATLIVFGICPMSGGGGWLGAWSTNPNFKWVDEYSVHDVDTIFLFLAPQQQGMDPDGMAKLQDSAVGKNLHSQIVGRRGHRHPRGASRLGYSAIRGFSGRGLALPRQPSSLADQADEMVSPVALR